MNDGPILVEAPLWRRAAAGLIDIAASLPLVYFAVVAAARLTSVAFLSSEGAAFYEQWAVVLARRPELFLAMAGLASAVVAAVRYPFEVMFGGSPGDMLMGLMLVTPSGRAVPWWRLLLRDIAFVLSTMFLGLGHLWAMWDWSWRPLHEKLTFTHLVRK